MDNRISDVGYFNHPTDNFRYLIILSMKRYLYLISFLAVLVILFIIAVLPLLDSRLHIVFCDVGQGDGILIYKKQTQIIVDAGPDGSMVGCLSKHMPFWDRNIELSIITNADLDHYGGFIDIVERYNIAMIAVTQVGKEDAAFETLEKEVRVKNIKTVTLSSGSKIKLRELEFLTYWPEKEFIDQIGEKPSGGAETVLGALTANNGPNTASLVLGMSYGEFDLLLTGDIVPPATDYAAENINKNFEVLKVPHHGSKNGLTSFLLEKTKPKLGVISAGRKNQFGHPHDETINLLKDAEVKIMGTYERGDIRIITDGRNWYVK